MFLRKFKLFELCSHSRYHKLQPNGKRSYILTSTKFNAVRIELDKELEQKLENEELKV